MPCLKGVVETVGYGLGGLAVQSVVAFAVQCLGLSLRQPVALSVDEPPVPLRHGGPQIPRSPRKAVEPVGSAQFEFASQVHTETQRLRVFPVHTDRQVLLTGREESVYVPRSDSSIKRGTFTALLVLYAIL